MNVYNDKIGLKLKRLYWIDFLRGLAALSVLFWHYQIFYFTRPGTSILASTSSQPLYSFFSFLYLHGHLAVQLFWCISGFVFSYVYSEALTPQTLRSFFINRFARLYPLHFITLIIVALLQLISSFLVGHDQVYPYNDLYHFILNIFFASNWGFEKGFSFNAPIWSVSVEVVVYLMFVIFQRIILRKPIISLLLCSVFLLLYTIKYHEYLFWRCACFFFAGCFIFQYKEVLISFERKFYLIFYPIFSIGILLVSIKLSSSGFLFFGEVLLVTAISFMVITAHIVDEIDKRSIGSKLILFGDMTYSSYLWHVPIQIITLLLVEKFQLDRSLFSHPFSLLAFLTIVFIVAFLSFQHIELPAQRVIKKSI